VLAGREGSPWALTGGAEPPQGASTLLKMVCAMGLGIKCLMLWVRGPQQGLGCWSLVGAEAEGETHLVLLENARVQSPAAPCQEHHAYRQARWGGGLSRRAGFFLDGAKRPAWTCPRSRAAAGKELPSLQPPAETQPQISISHAVISRETPPLAALPWAHRQPWGSSLSYLWVRNIFKEPLRKAPA